MENLQPEKALYGIQVEKAVKDRVRCIMEGRKNPNVETILIGKQAVANQLSPQDLKDPTTSQDKNTGTDQYVLDTPVDYTIRPIDGKDFIHDLGYEMHFPDVDLRVSFGIRHGNSYKGYTQFQVPVLVASLRGDAISSPSSAADALEANFDDIFFASRILYDNNTGRQKPLTVLISDEDFGVYLTPAGRKNMKNNAAKVTDYQKNDMNTISNINPHAKLVLDLLHDEDVLLYAVAKQGEPDNDSEVLYATPQNVKQYLPEIVSNDDKKRVYEAVWDIQEKVELEE